MKQETGQDEPHFRVLCAWCGETISLNSVKDINAMCLDCYGEMLAGHFRAEAQTDLEIVASER